MDTSSRTNIPQDSSTLDAAAQAAQEKVDQVSEQLAQKGEQIQAGVAAATEAAQSLMQAAGEQLTEYAKATDQTIRKHPYQAIGIALGAGLLCGYLLSRK